jgi:hypothetical protein
MSLIDRSFRQADLDRRIAQELAEAEESRARARAMLQENVERNAHTETAAARVADGIESLFSAVAAAPGIDKDVLLRRACAEIDRRRGVHHRHECECPVALEELYHLSRFINAPW